MTKQGYLLVCACATSARCRGAEPTGASGLAGIDPYGDAGGVCSGRHGIPVQEVLDLDHLEDSAYLTERGFLRRQIHPSEGGYVSIRFPVDFSLTPVAVPRPAPRLGEHNAKIRTGEGR
jgi:CoA-transferase family III